MKALDFAKFCGTLAVQKRVTGAVVVTTTPPRTLLSGEVVVLATTTAEVLHIVESSNIKSLVASRDVALVF